MKTKTSPAKTISTKDGSIKIKHVSTVWSIGYKKVGRTVIEISQSVNGVEATTKVALSLDDTEALADSLLEGISDAVNKE